MLHLPILLLFLVLVVSHSTTVVHASGAGDDDDVYCLTLHEDLMRRQSDEWGSTAPFTIDDGTKHTPFTTFDAETRTATIIVGNGDAVGGVYHPMVASDNPTTVHFITHIYAVDQNNNLFAVETMDPNMPAPATVIFDVPASVTEMTAYEFCNLHGLWRGPTISTVKLSSDSNVTLVEEKQGTAETVTTANNNMLMCHIDSPISIAYDSFAADFVRRQSLPPFNSLEPYDEDDGTKHTPYTTINANGTATVTVGVEGNYHVMKGASRELDSNGDRVEPHWITEVYVVDQNNDIITMESLNPTHMDIAQITFDIPPSATTLTAYEWCNVHGLYVGPTVSVATGEIVYVVDEEEEGNLESAAIMRQAGMVAAAGLAAAALLLL